MDSRERARRSAVDRLGRANCRLEGGDISEFASALSNDYLDGRVSASQVVCRVRGRYGLEPER